MISARKAKQRDAKTMFTYAHANTPLGQSQRAYYLSYFIKVVGCLYTDVKKTSISNFRRVGTAFSGELPQARTILLFGGYSGQIFPCRNLLTRRRKQYQLSLHVISLAVRDRQ